jgi:hypothetical protein
MLLSSDLQWAHSLHSPMNIGSTWSPGASSATPSPTLSIILSIYINHHSLGRAIQIIRKFVKEEKNEINHEDEQKLD